MVKVHRRVTGAIVMVCMMATFAAPTVSGCSAAPHDEPEQSTAATSPRRLTSDEADRLAVVRFNNYRAKVLSVEGTVNGESGSAATLRGWVDTVDHTGYGLVSSGRGGQFLSFWDSTSVNAQDFRGTDPPLPRPDSGWDSTTLAPDDSELAAAQLMLISLSNDRPDNPQLLLQGGATWVGSGTVNGSDVDIMTGPMAPNATVSNIRYWVDGDGRLMRLQARLDGRTWSDFDFTAASEVTF